jgi:hypothetical protein
MKAVQDTSLRQHVANLLSGKGAHVDFTEAVHGVPVELRGKRVSGIPHSLWELVEHIRIAQWDILEFSRNPKHVSPKWPEGHWPKIAEPPDAAAWDASIAAVEKDRNVMKRLVLNPKTDLFAKIPHGEGQTILREALLVADHNAYHVGEIVIVRCTLGIWGA